MLNKIQPKEIKIGEREYEICKFPALEGREIIANYSTSMIPKIGDYHLNEEMLLKIMKYVSVKRKDGEWQELSTRALIDGNVPNWEDLAHIEWAIMEYNCSFLQRASQSSFWDGLMQKATAAAPKIIETLTPLLAQLSPENSPRSKNARKSTASRK